MTPNRPSGVKTVGTILMLFGGVTIALGLAFAVLIEITTNCPEHPAPDGTAGRFRAICSIQNPTY